MSDLLGVLGWLVLIAFLPGVSGLSSTSLSIKMECTKTKPAPSTNARPSRIIGALGGQMFRRKPSKTSSTRCSSVWTSTSAHRSVGTSPPLCRQRPVGLPPCHPSQHASRPACCSAGEWQLRAYPKSPAARKLIQAQAKWSIAR